jgi:ABC-type branched-subunit amino acid transport system ATPase component/ABC-type branched-subunit amino acid transport system permease subunit
MARATTDRPLAAGEPVVDAGAPAGRRGALSRLTSFPMKMLLGLVVVAIIPSLVTDHYYLYSLTVGAVYLIAALGLNVTISGGIISIGTSAFLMVGAYTVGLTQVHWHLNAVPATLMATAICAAIGLVTAFPALKMGPFAVAVVTLMYANVANDLFLHFTSFTGGSAGVQSRPGQLTAAEQWFLAAGVAAIFFVGHRNLVRSPMGRALMMGRRSEPVAASLGISTARFKLASFAIYAGLCGVGGAVFQMLTGPISTETFDIGISITVLLMVVLGGEASVPGPLLGALALTLIPLLLNQTVSHGGAVREIIYGVVLLAVVLVVPGGIAGIGERITVLARRLTRWRRQPEAAENARQGRIDTAELEAVLSRVDDPVELELLGVCKSIGGLRILVDTSFRVEGGTIHGLIGPNGSGKTTLLNCASGLTRVDSGEVLLGGERLPGVASRHARSGIGRTFQTVLLAEGDSVSDNLLVGVDAHRQVSFASYVLRTPHALAEARQSRAEVARWASALGLGHLLHSPVHSLTPRDRRLVEIGRALATRPRVLLLDEPAAGLTSEELEELEELMRLLRDSGITVVLVEHHAELVMRLCDRVTVIDVGRVLITDDPATVSADPAVVAAYLGDELTESGAATR